VESRSGASALLNDSRSGASALLNDCPLTTYAHDLADVAGALALTNVPLVGISMGALTSVQCFHLGLGGRFARYMHIDQGLVICNSDGYAHGLLGGSQPGFFARMRRLVDALDPHVEAGYAQLAPDVLQQMASVFAEFTAAAFTRRSLQQAVYRLTNQPRLLRFFLPEEGFATHLQIMRAYLDNNYDLRDAFRAIEVPTTVLIGGASRMYPPEGQRSIGQYAPRARLCELPGVGHMLPLEAPRRFVRELHCFLSDTG
jgi:non-heme chloroperoxidase